MLNCERVSVSIIDAEENDVCSAANSVRLIAMQISEKRIRQKRQTFSGLCFAFLRAPTYAPRTGLATRQGRARQNRSLRKRAEIVVLGNNRRRTVYRRADTAMTVE